MDAFWGLAPPTLVQVQPALLPRSSKVQGTTKAPAVRCLHVPSTNNATTNNTTTPTHGPVNRNMDVANVDSVDKVYRILTHYLHIPHTHRRQQLKEALQWKYRGNGCLEIGKIDLAIDAYNHALAMITTTSSPSSNDTTNDTNQTNSDNENDNDMDDDRVLRLRQQGIVLFMRATAYLRRAEAHKQELTRIVQELIETVPETSNVRMVYQQAAKHPALARSILRRLLEDTDSQKLYLSRTQYRHGLYQYALLHAVQDSLQATELMPYYAAAWCKCAEILSELWRLPESAQYYQRAMTLDPSLQPVVTPILERLEHRQELLDSAREYGWSEDTVRMALDASQ